MTPDAHPIHIHLIQFQVIDVQPFNTEADLCPYTGQGNFDFSGPQYRAAWDALFPGGTFGGFTFPAGTFIPGFGAPLGRLSHPERRRRNRRQSGLRHRQWPVLRRAAGAARSSRRRVEGHVQDVPLRRHPDRASLGAAGRRRGPDPRRNEPLPLRSHDGRAGLRLAPPHPRPRGQRDDAAVLLLAK